MRIKKLTKPLALLLAAIMCASSLTACVFGNSSEAKYLKAFELTEKGEYEAAYALFVELGDYKDAEKEAAKFHYIATKETAEFITADGTEIENIVISFNENNLPVSCNKTGADGYQHTCLLTYTERGELAKVACSDTDGVTETAEYFYDQNGRLSKESFDYGDGFATYEYTYTESGEIATLNITLSSGSYSYEYFYNEEGKETHAIVTTSLGSTYDYESFYDENGYLTKEIVTDENGVESMRNEYIYDEKGRMIKDTCISPDFPTSVFEYFYDDNDRTIREIYDFGEGDITTYEYTFDANGNIIKWSSETSDGREEIFTTEYKLFYVPFEYSAEQWDDIIYGLTGW